MPRHWVNLSRLLSEQKRLVTQINDQTRPDMLKYLIYCVLLMAKIKF